MKKELRQFLRPKSHGHFMCTVLCSFALLGIAQPSIALASDAASAINVDVAKRGEQVVVDVNFEVAVTPQQAWEVLTDFDHMRDFVSNLQMSRVVVRNGTRWQVAQKGAARRGPLQFSFDSVRDLDLVPFDRITSKQVSGNMKKFEATTRLSAQAGGTRIQYHAESIPNTYVPPVVGTAFIETESRRQFEEMRSEMLRRSALAAK